MAKWRNNGYFKKNIKGAHINPILQRTAEQQNVAGETVVEEKETSQNVFPRGETYVFTAEKKTGRIGISI